ncbi:hypothetical protein VSDKYIMU_CDS0182 [Enterococcus phage VRE9_4]
MIYSKSFILVTPYSLYIYYSMSFGTSQQKNAKINKKNFL